MKENIIECNIGDYCVDMMKIFGANINIARHIPLLIDSLKPVERRILYAMYLDGALNHFSKVAAFTGTTMNKFHPHGDIPIYKTLVRLAQPWNMMIPLVEKGGNFGSISGFKAGSPRYIEAKLSKYSYKCFFEEFDETIVDMKDNYNQTCKEPEYLPCKYPNILINPASGIGYGLAVGIPCYNFKEVVELTIKLIRDPEFDECVLIPDSPTGCFIIDNGQFDEISATGKGKFMMRGDIEIDNDRNCITIKSVPYQVKLNDVKENIIKLYDEKKIPGITSIKDETSDKNGVVLRIFLKKEVNPHEIVQMIYKKTEMERTFSVQFKLIDDNQDYNFTLRSLLLEWISIRKEQKRRVYTQKLSKLKNREHILEILLFILNKNNAENTIKIIKDSENKKSIVSRLMEVYGITSLQADIIAEMRLHAFSKEARRRYQEEKDNIGGLIDDALNTLSRPTIIDQMIIKELEEGVKLFGEPRRSKIISIKDESYVRDTRHLLVFTKDGYVKKLPHNVENIGFIRNGDKPLEIFAANNRSNLLLFDERGKISRIPINDIRNHEISSEGEKLNRYCNINGNVISVLIQPTEEALASIDKPVYFLFITKNGLMKKTSVDKYINIRSELLSLILKEDDSLVQVKTLLDDRDVLVHTKEGLGIRFNSSEIKDTGRMTVGINVIPLSATDRVLGFDFLNDRDSYILIITTKGVGKKCAFSNFKQMHRNDQPLKLINLDDEEEIAIVRASRGDERFIVYTKTSIEEIDSVNIPEMTRMSKGKKLLALGKGNFIVDIKEIKV